MREKSNLLKNQKIIKIFTGFKVGAKIATFFVCGLIAVVSINNRDTFITFLSRTHLGSAAIAGQLI